MFLLGWYHPHVENVYIGRPSVLYLADTNEHVRSWFAHGGCDFCLSRHFARLMRPYVTGGLLISLTYTNNDLAIADIVKNRLWVSLVVNQLLNSHYHINELEKLTVAELRKQVSLSYKGEIRVRIERNDTEGEGGTYFDEAAADPSRLFTIPCLNEPHVEYCAQGRSVP